MKEKLSFKEFVDTAAKLEIKTGTITSAERIPKSTKMLKLTVDFGNGDLRDVATNIGSKYTPEYLVNQTLPFVTNLDPVTIMGVDSRAMIVAAELDGVPFILNNDNSLPKGANVL